MFRKGVLHGLPIALGYFSVSIGFGLLAVSGGLPIWEAVLISMVNLTSAGQLAGVQVMFSAGTLFEMGITQLFINIRYALMAIVLSQKMDEEIRLPSRLAFSFFLTDEIFAVASGQEAPVAKSYFFGLAVLPYFGWALGTLTGAVASAILPTVIRDGLGIMIYGMFLAIIVPPAKSDKPVRAAVLIAAALSAMVRLTPGLRNIPVGFSIVLCALSASAACAIRYPLREVT